LCIRIQTKAPPAQIASSGTRLARRCSPASSSRLKASWVLFCKNIEPELNDILPAQNEGHINWTIGHLSVCGGNIVVETAIRHNVMPQIANMASSHRTPRPALLQTGAKPIHSTGIPASMYLGPYEEPPRQAKNEALKHR